MDARDAQLLGGDLRRRNAVVGVLLPLERESRHQVEVVAAPQALLVVERVFVRPARLVGPVDGAVDALAAGRAGVARVGFAAVELLAAAFVQDVAARGLERQVGGDLPRQRQVGVEVVHQRLAVFVLGGLHRVEAVVVRSVYGFVEHRVEDVLPGRRYGAVAPDRVHQPARRRRGGLRRGGGHAVGRRARIVGVGVQREFFRDGQREVGLALVALEVRTDDDAVLVERREAHVVAQPLLVAARERDVVVLLESRAVELVLPVDARDVAVVVERQSLAEIALVHRLLADQFALKPDEFVGVHQVGLVGDLVQGERGAEVHRGLALVAAFGVDHDDAVGSARSVDGGRRSVFQHVDRLDVRGVDRRGERPFGRESVDDVERGVALRERVVSADGDIGFGAQRAVARGDDHAGDASAQRLVEVGDVGLHHRSQVGLGHRAGEVAPRGGSVADVDDLDGADLRRLFGHLDVDRRAFADILLDGRVAQIGEDQRLVLPGLDRVAAVGARGRSRLRPLDQDGYAHQRCTVGVNHASVHGVLRKGFPPPEYR